MADQHDGSIIIDTGIDTDGFEKGSKKLLQAIKSLTDKIEPLGKNLKSALSGTGDLAKAASTEVKGLSDSMTDLKKASKSSRRKDKNDLGLDVDKAKADADAYSEILDDLSARQDRIYTDAQNTALGGDTTGAIDTAKQRIAEAQEELRQLEEMLGGDTDTLGKQNRNLLLGDLSAIREGYRILEEQIRHVGAAEADLTKKSSSGNSARKVMAESAEDAKEAVSQLRIEVETLEAATVKLTGSDPTGPFFNLQQAKQETAAYKKEVDAVVKSIEKLGPSFNKAMSGDSKAIAALEEKLGPLTSKATDLGLRLDQIGQTKIPTDSFAHIEQQIEETLKTLNKYKHQEKRALETEANQNTQGWRNLQWEIENTRAKLARLTAERNQMLNSGVAYTTLSKTAGFQSLSASLSEATGKLKTMSTGLSEVGSKAPSAAGVAKEALRGIGNVAKLAGKKLGVLVGKLHKTKKASKGIGRHLKSIGFMLKQMIAFRALYAVFSGIAQGIQNLAQASSAVNENMSALKSSLTQLKNSLATAFAPILTVVTPILVNFMSTLSRVLTIFGQFIAALTGAKTFTKAVAVQEDYAASLKTTSKAAKEAQRQLAGFDDLNVLNDTSTESDGTIDPSQMFEEVAIESPILNFANRLKEAFRSGDYEGIGQIVGEKINTALAKAGEHVSWDNVGGSVTTTVTGIARTVNSLFSAIDWTGAGQTVAEGVNTIVNTLHLGFTGIDWKLIGKSLADGLDGAIAGIDWAKLGSTIASYFNIAIQGLLGFLQNLDWHAVGKAIGEALGEAISNIDWASLASILWEVVKAAFEAFCGFLEGLGPEIILAAIAAVVAVIAGKIAVASLLAPIVSAIGSALATIVGGICTAIAGWPALVIAAIAALIAVLVVWLKNGGKDIVAGWLEGMKQGLSNLGTWIRKNLVDPFVAWFKNLFGIHSPSTVMATLGGYLVSGLYQGLSSAWSTITGFLSQGVSSIRTNLSNGWQKLRQDATIAWGNVGTAIRERWNSIQSQASTWGRHICDNLAKGIRNGVSKVRSAATNIASTIKSILGFSEPEAGPLSNFHTYMPDMLDLMEEGILANTYKAADAAAHVAQAISNEVQNGDYTTGKILPDSQVDTALTSFSDKISDSFTSLLDRLQSIANGVTFTTPVAASGVVPYSVSAKASGSDGHMGDLMNANNEALMTLLSKLFPQAVTEIVNAIYGANNNGSSGMDPNMMVSYVLSEINRRTNMIGLSPIVG